ncbi:hypothetical protein PoB_000204600 [Plakobranchus ocellatus]|uniref:Uncharacterized protein n=1 Tax=Plakobranchus ocellatus TaxID=259542 RepID=A0AAV3XXI6_9GAST|nr:hypothetical protein PoB_000204600 [Plakobranchus ocellatus]
MIHDCIETSPITTTMDAAVLVTLLPPQTDTIASQQSLHYHQRYCRCSVLTCTGSCHIYSAGAGWCCPSTTTDRYHSC